MDRNERVQLSLWTADAVVLFDWLMRADLTLLVGHEHPSVKQALTDLVTVLEQTDVASSSVAEIAAAQADVSRDMGW